MKEGLYAFWKPKGVSSNGFLNQLRREIGIKKMGHTGTLDPLAEGVLVVGIGKGTKLIAGESGAEKEYIAVVRLGVTSETDDEEGKKTEMLVTRAIGEEEVLQELSSFKGIIKQIPPVYSAIKIQGQEAYKLVRAGKAPIMQAREAEIKEIAMLSYEWPFVSFRIVTGPGVYIRAIARDLGEKLKVGGHLASLQRIRVGHYTKDDIIDNKKL